MSARVFKKLRVTLIRELPDPVAMLDSPELKGSFSGYERSQILTPPTMSRRAEKFVDVMELCSDEVVFENFLSLLRRLKPNLAKVLESALREVEETPNAETSNGAATGSSDGGSCCKFASRGYSSSNTNEPAEERVIQPVAINNRQPQALNQGQEDAGVYGLNGYGEDARLISYLSYNCREYLASELNTNPPEREVFHSFCRALGVENRLVQVSARSRNPTGYLLQKCSTEPLESLNRALTEIGKGYVFQELLIRMREDGGLPDDDV